MSGGSISFAYNGLCVSTSLAVMALYSMTAVIGIMIYQEVVVWYT